MDNVVILVADDAPRTTGPARPLRGARADQPRWNDSGVLPDRITVYRQPILSICDSEEDVVEEVSVTVIHEIAHHFGIDDEVLHHLGWG
jgi:predicted Zn-dependent protease with MMP-like domain